MMAAFPAFVLLGSWLSARGRLAAAWVGASAVLAVVMMSAYAHGVYLT
jgi:hypothetical protein